MPPPKKGPRLGGSPAHQRLMVANLATSLFEHGRITTTEAKARVLRPFAEKLITKAKKGDLHNRRQVLSTIRDKGVVHALFEDIAPRYAERPGGYTRITKIGPRKGDNAPMAVVELVTEDYAPRARTTRSAATPAPQAAPAPEVEETTAEDAAVEETTAQDSPAEATPAEDVAVEDAPAEDVATEESPVEDTPTQAAPAEDAPAEKAGGKNNPPQARHRTARAGLRRPSGTRGRLCSPPVGRMRACGCVSTSPMTAPSSTGGPRSRPSAPSRGCSRAPSPRCSAWKRSRSPARVAPTA